MPKDATDLSLYEDQKFYNSNYTVSKLRAKEILSDMKMKLIQGFGNAVTYINFVHSYNFMALFDVLSKENSFDLVIRT